MNKWVLFVNMTSGEFMFKIHLCSYVTLFGLKSDEMTKLIISISFPLSGSKLHYYRASWAWKPMWSIVGVAGLVDALEHLLLCFWNQIATCISCLDFWCCRSCWCVLWVVSLFNVNMRLYLLFWAAKIWYVFWGVMIILV